MNLNLKREKEPIKTEFYYGWVVLVMAALAYFFSGPGQTYSISIFIDHYIENFGWSRSLVSTLYSAGTLVSGLVFNYGTSGLVFCPQSPGEHWLKNRWS
ncbi:MULTISPECIES: hypothetical protein [Halanaerobium]|uniref:hypothetical protein n=1 Tax=Halanaerobium TaxID=2330 RepID=UPI001AADB486|nr:MULTISPECIES: hypothetical protein [Halanaerobium]